MRVRKELPWTEAVMLVAGAGDRLKPRTHDQPKPLTEVNGVAILENALTNLAEFGIQRVHLVTGYLHEKLMDFARSHSAGMEIIEIFSPEYARTNNMYSLWLARHVLEAGCLVVEGDVFFEEAVLEKLRDVDASQSYWLADRFTSASDGCMLTTESDGLIAHLEIVRARKPDDLTGRYKSIGILALNRETGSRLVRWLREDIDRGRVGVYYDLVLADHLDEAGLRILDVHGTRWFEIDDEQDLIQAERLFQSGK
jgi:choline kinase